MKIIALLLFYSFLIGPFWMLVQLTKNGTINNNSFAIILLFYALIYHPFVSVILLHLIGKIAKKDMLTNMLPFRYLRYAKDLYVG